MSQQAAVLTGKGEKFQIQTIEKHTAKAGEILIKAHVVSTNPADGIVQNFGLFIDKYPAVIGFDVAGTVEEIGEGVTRFKKGDKVISFVFEGPYNLRYGAFQEYPIAHDRESGLIPNSLSFEQAATLIAPTLTAASGLFVDLKLPRPTSTTKPAITKDSEVFYVNSGSSAVGAAAVQLAVLLGYRVISTSSPRNFDLLKSLGASEVFDYNDSDLVKKVQSAAGRKINVAFDAASNDDSIEKSINILNGSGKLVVVKPSTFTEKRGVGIASVQATSIVKETESSTWWWNYFKSIVEAGSYVGLPHEVLGHGLKDIQKVVDHHHAKKVSGTKPVIKLI